MTPDSALEVKKKKKSKEQKTGATTELGHEGSL